MREIKAPHRWRGSCARPLAFLAGSIEMGGAPPWQRDVVRALRREPGTILNPRRDDWDSSWEQRADNPQFREQVEWELDGMCRADVVLMWFAPGTKSPITLLELGLSSANRGLIVGCPDGFWRSGNVHIVCERMGVPMVKTTSDLVSLAKAMMPAHARSSRK